MNPAACNVDRLLDIGAAMIPLEQGQLPIVK
jgi:hypothetical protein